MQNPFRIAFATLICVILSAAATGQGTERLSTKTGMVPPATPCNSSKSQVTAEKATESDLFLIRSFPLSESERRIEVALGANTANTFQSTPLREAIQSISVFHKIPMMIDERSLTEIGLDANVPVTIDLKDVSLRAFLRILLRDLDCTYAIADEVLWITTPESAEDGQFLHTRVYRLPSALANRADHLISMIELNVCPDTWSVQGPCGSSIDHVLVISTSTDKHFRIEQFLSRVSKAHLLGPVE